MLILFIENTWGLCAGCQLDEIRRVPRFFSKITGRSGLCENSQSTDCLVLICMQGRPSVCFWTKVLLFLQFTA